MIDTINEVLHKLHSASSLSQLASWRLAECDPNSEAYLLLSEVSHGAMPVLGACEFCLKGNPEFTLDSIRAQVKHLREQYQKAEALLEVRS